MNKYRKEAEELRAKGYSYSIIQQRLGVSKSTLSNWFKDEPFTPNQEVLDRVQYGPIKSATKRHNKRVKEIETLKSEGMKEIGEVSGRDLWMLGIGLYIGEGSKTIESVRIINSDPLVIRLAIRWLCEVCGLQKDNITIAIHLYPDSDIEEALKYWQSITELPMSNFRKTQIDKRNNKSNTKKGTLPYGTAHLAVITNGDPSKGVRLYRKMNGWIAGALGDIIGT